MEKRTTKKGASRSQNKAPILALSAIEEKEIDIDAETYAKLEKFLSKSGASKSGLSISDVVAHLLIDKGPNGFKFSSQKNEPVKVKLSLPKAAWDIADKSAQKSGVSDLGKVVSQLVH